MADNKLILLADHIAKGNPSGLAEVAKANRYAIPRSYDGRIGFIVKFVQDKKDQALKQLATIHPDRDLIISSESLRVSNADGTAETTAMITTPAAASGPSGNFPFTHLVLLFILAILLIAIVNGKI